MSIMELAIIPKLVETFRWTENVENVDSRGQCRGVCRVRVDEREWA